MGSLEAHRHRLAPSHSTRSYREGSYPKSTQMKTCDRTCCAVGMGIPSSACAASHRDAVAWRISSTHVYAGKRASHGCGHASAHRSGRCVPGGVARRAARPAPPATPWRWPSPPVWRAVLCPQAWVVRLAHAARRGPAPGPPSLPAACAERAHSCRGPSQRPPGCWDTFAPSRGARAASRWAAAPWGARCHRPGPPASCRRPVMRSAQAAAHRRWPHPAQPLRHRVRAPGG
jgi:hypothetical protein